MAALLRTKTVSKYGQCAEPRISLNTRVIRVASAFWRHTLGWRSNEQLPVSCAQCFGVWPGPLPAGRAAGGPVSGIRGGPVPAEHAGATLDLVADTWSVIAVVALDRGATLGATRMNNLGVLRTRMDNRERRAPVANGFERVWTPMRVSADLWSGACAWKCGWPPRTRRRSVHDSRNSDGGAQRLACTTVESTG